MTRYLIPMLAIALVAGVAALFTSSNARAEPAAVKAKVGQPAPQFTLTDQTGKEVKLSDYAGKIVVLEWFNEQCPFVVKFYKDGHMNKFASELAAKDVVWLAVNSSNFATNDTNKKVAGEWSINRPILNDASGAVGNAYGAKTTPHMYVINKDGVLAYAGAIDDKRSTNSGDIDGAKNYVKQAVNQLLAGQSVSEPETQAYGCSVKYAK
jgi:peroxiredoxin